MRTVAAFILRLFVDDAAPGRLVGTLQASDGEEKLPFHDDASLLAQLRLVMQAQPANPPPPPGESAAGSLFPPPHSQSS